MTRQGKSVKKSHSAHKDQLHKTRKRSGTGGRRRSGKHRGIRFLRFLLILLLCIGGGLLAAAGTVYHLGSEQYRDRLSGQVLDYRPDVEAAAEEYGISEYVPCLLAIMQVESKGKGGDVMQASESMGLSPNTLTAEESIRQGCRYFAELLRRPRQREAVSIPPRWEKNMPGSGLTAENIPISTPSPFVPTEAGNTAMETCSM